MPEKGKPEKPAEILARLLSAGLRFIAFFILGIAHILISRETNYLWGSSPQWTLGVFALSTFPFFLMVYIWLLLEAIVMLARAQPRPGDAWKEFSGKLWEAVLYSVGLALLVLATWVAEKLLRALAEEGLSHVPRLSGFQIPDFISQFTLVVLAIGNLVLSWDMVRIFIPWFRRGPYPGQGKIIVETGE
jgi:hypothetical protein